MAPSKKTRDDSESSLFDDEKALELLVRQRDKVQKEARAAKEQATTALAQAETAASKYRNKVKSVLDSYQTRVTELIALQVTKEAEIDKEIRGLHKQMSELLDRHATAVQHFLSTTVDEIEELHQDCDVQCQRLAYLKDEGAKEMQQAVPALWSQEEAR
ncbi:hypothetical protein ACM66B_001265 [Microbotryomycetes sp. NB124-2]